MSAFPPGRLRNVRWRDVIKAMRRGTRHSGADVDARGAALAILSLDGRFIAVNGGTAFLLGYPNDALLGRTLMEMAGNDDGARGRVIDGITSCAAGAFLSFSAALSGHDGRASTFLIHQHPITDRTGSVSAILTIFEELDPACKALSAESSTIDEASRRHRYACLMIGQERERNRIASELHDGLGQALTLIKLTVEDALIRLHGGRTAEAHELLDAAVARICEAIGDVRQICSDLHPVLLDRLGLVAALASLCSRVDDHTQRLRVYFKSRVEDMEIPDNLKTDIFRITQEAINNAVRHGSASAIHVRLDRLEAGVLLTIQDDGIGFDSLPVAADAASVDRLGLIGMQQRVESAGGSFVIQSSETGGTLVSALWRI